MSLADTAPPPADRAVALPAAAVLVAGVAEAAWLSPEGEIAVLPLAAAARHARAEPPILCHARATARRLGVAGFPALDVLELYAFARPAQFCLPTPRGLAHAVGLEPPRDLAAAAYCLGEAARRLLAELAAAAPDPDARAIALGMERGGWGWAAAVLAALAAADTATTAGLAQWRRLPEWSEFAPEPSPGDVAVEEHEARARLASLLGGAAEARPQQADYAAAVSAAFRPRERPGEPHFVLAEAGTGVGKTLGYVAPASLWAEKNEGAVWVSTFTRNLQHQIVAELDRLYPDPAEKARNVVLRKGRENYLCLLNFEEAVAALPMRPYDAAALGIMARWVGATRDGDMVGGDMPGWFPDVIGRGASLGLADRRGECIHSACLHYHRCFIEKGVRRARRARIVVANHALVMVQAALGGLDDSHLPTRYVFDEGHHVFEAADSTFAVELSGREAAELRRWLIGAEPRGRSRVRGLRRRLEDLVAGDGPAERALLAVTIAAQVLPGDGFMQRVIDGRPEGECEALFVHAREQILARAGGIEQGYDLEAALRPPCAGLVTAAGALAAKLAQIEAPMRVLAERLMQRLADDAAQLDTGTRLRIEAVVRGLVRRGGIEIGGWRRLLEDLVGEAQPEFVDWLALERNDGHELDIAVKRHWVEPMKPFAETVAKPAHGVLVTSATLTDGSGDALADWAAAEARVGAHHLAGGALRVRVPSPFDYSTQTRIYIVTDVNREDVRQVAGAYRALILAAGGGTLGLFTAIQRLRAVHALIAAPLEAAGLPLLAQHVDGMDTATLVDIFRAEEDASLLGTDAVRDGVDVPGRSLRLIVFDRVPWPRPGILHKARRQAFGGARYDDSLTRLRLRQAFGRLVRRADDCGVFVLLDRMLPSRLLGAFPDGVSIARVGLKEAIEGTAAFLYRENASAVSEEPEAAIVRRAKSADRAQSHVARPRLPDSRE